MRVGGAARTSLCPPSHCQARRPLARLPALLPRPSHSPARIGPWSAEASPPGPGRASTEMENVKGTFLRSLTARKQTAPAPGHSSLSGYPSKLPPGWASFDFNGSGGRFNPLSLLLWFGF